MYFKSKGGMMFWKRFFSWSRGLMNIWKYRSMWLVVRRDYSAHINQNGSSMLSYKREYIEKFASSVPGGGVPMQVWRYFLTRWLVNRIVEVKCKEERYGK